MIVQQLSLFDRGETVPIIAVNRSKKPTFALRTYQKQVIAQIYRNYLDGIKSVMLVSPTGSGKTLTASHIVRDAVSKNCQTLFIVHREPLVEQTVATLTRYGVAASTIGYIKAGYPAPAGDELVIVASIQTLARRDYPTGIGLVIFDECHTTAFYQTAQDLIQYYSQAPLLQWSKVKFLHLTATPYRTKAKEGFCNFVQRKVLAPDISELIKMGYLCSARHFGYGGLLDFAKLETGSDGDYKKSQLNTVCSDPEYNQQIVDKYLEICPHRKAIAFSAGVEQSKLLTKLLREKGIVAEHIQAETPTVERQAIFTRFKQGITQILSSVGTLTEGFDEPTVEAVILARPTKSLALLIQMCGRGLRIHPDKEDCFLLDFGENFKRLGFLTSDRPVSLCPQPKRNDAEKTKDCPNCGVTMSVFTRICPECGYEFPPSDEVETADSLLSKFGELLDPETTAKVKYIRAQRKARFTKRLDPETIWQLWDSRYPHELLCNDWLYQAVNRGDNSTVAQQEFLAYLLSFNYGTSWTEFQMKLEFGDTAIQVSDRLFWWEVLQIARSATPFEIKQQYRHLVAVYQGFEEQIKLLNFALDRGLIETSIELR